MVLEEKILLSIKKEISSYRLQHTEGVVKVAERMAAREGIPVEKARIAALLHDIAKDLPEKRLIKLASDSDWEIDEYEKRLPQLLHAPVGADIARRKFNISDYDILEAIRYHTVGSPDMGKLALIIFVADMIEPGRNFSGVDAIRTKARVSLIDSIIAVCNHSLKYNISKDRVIHPNTLLLRNKYLGGN